MNQTTKTAVTWIGGILGGGLGLAILGFAMQFWIAMNVASQLLAAGVVPKTEIDVMQGDIEENAEDIIRVESKAERIAQILMED